MNTREMVNIVEFVYNRAIYTTTHCSLFEVVYRFNPLMPLDLLPIPLIFLGVKATTNKVDLIKTLQKEMKERIDKQNFKVASIITKDGRKSFFNTVTGFD